MLILKSVMAGLGLKQASLARVLDLSPAAMSQIINHDLWPKSFNKSDLQSRTMSWLEDKGAQPEQLKTVFEMAGLSQATLPTSKKQSLEKDDVMLLRKQHLTQKARQTFKLTRDPFMDPRSSEEVFMTPDARYVRESMRAAARHGGFIAVVGESGSGKSTLRKDLAEWAREEQKPIIMIEPYVLGMEDNDIKGKTLKARNIAEAILAELVPHEKPKRSQDAFYRQLHEALRESHRAGNRHLLVIEEAQGLSIPTLKHLKRFFELEEGFSRLLSIILIGQTELGQKLDERNPSVREVVQRCEVVNLRPLDAELENYLHHRFAMANRSLVELMGDEAIQALRQKLSGRGNHSVLYPLAIHNVVTAALNEAAEIGLPKLNSDLILEV
ncbi:ExeA family protein [Oceanospirillum beijerinckii]|uniref:ExeA family protein n=1 Tax=Oceanospirillum beijerinckii TaxID=64976 RepID=UPI000400CCB8|nr:AAA family ATPase [Oceanospirillum beijerinckii]